MNTNNQRVFRNFQPQAKQPNNKKKIKEGITGMVKLKERDCFYEEKKKKSLSNNLIAVYLLLFIFFLIFF